MSKDQKQNEDQEEDKEASEAPKMIDIASLPIWQIIPFFMGILDRVAWQKIGLVVNPTSQEIEKDLEQAHLAIDAYEYLLGQVSKQLEQETRQAFEARLTDLKLNYAKQA
ncbi:MAG: DUF1844 domain-containing protein [Candidatus Hodarchaeota archaeon]